VLVSNIRGLKAEFEAKGAKIGNWRVDEREGQKYQVFFVVAPDGLCYYFHEPLKKASRIRSRRRDRQSRIARPVGAVSL
jgi:hypothetical protein